MSQWLRVRERNEGVLKIFIDFLGWERASKRERDRNLKRDTFELEREKDRKQEEETMTNYPP